MPRKKLQPHVLTGRRNPYAPGELGNAGRADAKSAGQTKRSKTARAVSVVKMLTADVRDRRSYYEAELRGISQKRRDEKIDRRISEKTKLVQAAQRRRQT